LVRITEYELNFETSVPRTSLTSHWPAVGTRLTNGYHDQGCRNAETEGVECESQDPAAAEENPYEDR
jgi:hypothetical protein